MSNKETVKERLKRYIDYKEISFRAFSLSIGMSENYISSMRSSAKPDIIHRIADHYPDLNTTWLVTGIGDMLNTDNNLNQDILKKTAKKNNMSIEELTSAIMNLSEAAVINARASEMNAKANIINAESSLTNSKNMERMLELISKNEKGEFVKQIIGYDDAAQAAECADAG